MEREDEFRTIPENYFREQIMNEYNEKLKIGIYQIQNGNISTVDFIKFQEELEKNKIKRLEELKDPKYNKYVMGTDPYKDMENDYLKELHIEQLATILDRLDVKYGILESRDQIIEYLIRHFNSSSIRKAHENFNDSNPVEYIFNKFIARRTDEEVELLLNMVGWDINEDDTADSMREDLFLQDYFQIYNFYLQLKNII